MEEYYEQLTSCDIILKSVASWTKASEYSLLSSWHSWVVICVTIIYQETKTTIIHFQRLLLFEKEFAWNGYGVSFGSEKVSNMQFVQSIKHFQWLIQRELTGCNSNFPMESNSFIIIRHTFHINSSMQLTVVTTWCQQRTVMTHIDWNTIHLSVK